MTKVIDGRQLVPPEPLELTLAALDDLAEGEEIVLLVNCQPQPLYRVLRRAGFAWREVAAPDGSFEIHIFRRA
jgi:uncharacterized protein (DUF2249 family)